MPNVALFTHGNLLLESISEIVELLKVRLEQGGEALDSL